MKLSRKHTGIVYIAEGNLGLSIINVTSEIPVIVANNIS